MAGTVMTETSALARTKIASRTSSTSSSTGSIRVSELISALALEPTDRRLGADDKTIDVICLAFAEDYRFRRKFRRTFATRSCEGRRLQQQFFAPVPHPECG
jgi:hypothetical protein